MGDAEKAGRGPLVKSADRALDLLELISAFPEQLTFSQIAEAVAMPKSSLSQLLSNLASRGYIEINRKSGKVPARTQVSRAVRYGSSKLAFRAGVAKDDRKASGRNKRDRCLLRKAWR